MLWDQSLIESTPQAALVHNMGIPHLSTNPLTVNA